jgi:hypothetical protein
MSWSFCGCTEPSPSSVRLPRRHFKPRARSYIIHSAIVCAVQLCAAVGKRLGGVWGETGRARLRVLDIYSAAPVHTTLVLNIAGLGTIGLKPLQLNKCKPGSGLHVLLLQKAVLSQPQPPRTDKEMFAQLLQAVQQTPTFGPVCRDTTVSSQIKQLNRAVTAVKKAGVRKGKYRYKGKFLTSVWGGCHPVGFRPSSYAADAVGSPAAPSHSDAAAVGSPAATSHSDAMETAVVPPGFWGPTVDFASFTPWVNTAVHLLQKLENQLLQCDHHAPCCCGPPDDRPPLPAEVWAMIAGFIPVGGWGARLPLGKRVPQPPVRYTVRSSLRLLAALAVVAVAVAVCACVCEGSARCGR